MSPVAPCAPPLAGSRPPSELPFRRAVATAVAVLGTTMLPVLLTASQAVEIQDDLSFGDGHLGLAVGAFWAAAALSSTPAGRVADVVGGGRGVRIGAAVAAAGTLGIALGAQVYAVFVALLAVVGTGLALVAPGMSALVSRQLQPGRLGVVLGFQQSGPPAASLVAGLALPAVATGAGWRWTFAAAALLILVAAAAVPTGDCTIDRRSAVAARPHGTLGLAVAGGLAAAAASAGITFLVPFATSTGLSPAQAGAVLAVAALVTMAVRIGAGARLDAGRVDPLRAMAVLLAAGAGGFVVLASGIEAAVAPAAVLAVGVGWGWGGLFVVSAIEQTPTAPGTAVGVAMRGVYAGAVAGPVLGGPLASSAPGAFWLGCAALAAAGAWTFHQRRAERPAPRPAVGAPG